IEFQGESAGRVIGLRRFATATALATVAVAVSPLALMPPARITASGAVFVQLTAAVSLLYARMRRAASRTERARLFYLWVGAALCVGLTFGELLIRLAGWPPPPFANVAMTVYLYFLSQTIQRHRLLDLNELLGKIVVLACVGLVLAAIYGLMVRWAGGAPTGLFLFNTLVASFVILILFEPLKAKVEEKALVQSAQAGQKAQLVELVERRLSELRTLLPDEEAGRATPGAADAQASAARTPELAALAEERSRLSEIGPAMAAMRAGVVIP